jgi:serine/threonine protein kinase/tetratricopeptide (TPR) repeat protein
MAEQRLDLEEIFFAARQKPPQERGAYLDQVCGADALLRQRAEQFLSAQGEIGSFLESGAVPLEATIDEPITERAGTSIGAYKLMEQIGEGGMGLVFVAEQQQPVRRKVALKVIKPGMDSRQIVARFEAERQALALMDHPNIAKIHDGGTAPSGRPYFVMELVKGVPITHYCDDHRLSPGERLELFVDVCAAVQHAHQKGIIHRDIKPSNVLVISHDGKPVIKVIDFGVAKAIGQQLTDKTIYTQFTQLVGTPLYMSPEQAGESGLDIDTRSDIYSLGVLLYELLTGTTPFDRERFSKAGYEEVRRIIREEEPPRPSTRLSTLGQAATTICANRKSDPVRLSQLLRGELDWIVMKALEKERNRRYETASALAAEVHRYLHDEPVQACPPSAGYRLRKFVRKHRGPVAAASVIALLLIAGIVGTTVGMMRAIHAKDNETAQLQKAVAAQNQALAALEATTDQVIEKLIGEKPALTVTEKEFLQNALQRWQAFAAEQGQGELSQRIRVTGVFRVAWLRDQLGQYQEARAGYEEHINRCTKLAAEFPEVTIYRQHLTDSYNALGVLLRHLGKWLEAETAYRQALAIEEKLATEFPTVPVYRYALARTQSNLGDLLGDLANRPEAEKCYRLALTIQGGRPAEFAAMPMYRQLLADTYLRLGFTQANLDMGPKAETSYRQAVAILEKLVAEFPGEPEYRAGLAQSYSGLGKLLSDLGKSLKAEAAYSQALAIQTKVVADFPVAPQYRVVLAQTRANLGVLLEELGKKTEAEAAQRQVLAMRAKLVAEYPGVPQYARFLVLSHIALGDLLRRLGRTLEAEQEYVKALAIGKKLTADFPDHPYYRYDLVDIHIRLGSQLKNLGKWPESEASYRKALAIQEKLVVAFPKVAKNRSSLAEIQTNLAGLLLRRDELREAEAAIRTALALNEKLAADFPAVPVYRALLAESQDTMAAILSAAGRPSEAEASCRTALAMWEKLVAEFPLYPNYRISLGLTQRNIGCFYQNKGQPEKALQWFDKTIGTLESALREVKIDVDARQYLCKAHSGRAELLAAFKRYNEAMQDWERARELAPEAERPILRLCWLTSRLHCGHLDGALKEVEELAKIPDPWILYNSACVFALEAEQRNESGASPSREECAKRAIALLQQAVARGWNDVELLKRDDDMKVLCGREDFKKLLAELEGSRK